MRPSSMILLLLFAPTALVAQTGTTATVFITPPASESCPVNFSIKRSPNFGLVEVKGAAGSHGQGLQLDFALPQSPIVKAYITVHGMS